MRMSATDEGKEIVMLDKWNVKVDSVELKNSALFDWRSNDQLKYSATEGVYTSLFEWSKTNTTTNYYFDLGKVLFTAEVFVNGKFAGKRIFAPYMLDITPYLLAGANTIEVHVTPGQLNSFINKANLGDSRYRQFRNNEGQLMSAGLLGPVVNTGTNCQCGTIT